MLATKPTIEANASDLLSNEMAGGKKSILTIIEVLALT